MIKMPEEALQKNKMLAQRFNELMSISGYLVGIKLIKDIEGWEKVKRPGQRRTLCQFISQSYYTGRSLIASAEHMACYASAEILGFPKEMPKEAWKRYVGWQMATEEAARKTFSEIMKFDLGEYNAIYISPLERSIVDPDVVIFFGNASQMLVVIASYLRSRGGSLQFSSKGMGSCSDVIVAVMKTKEPKISIPGNAWKILALPSDTDLICGIPGYLLEEIVENAAILRTTGGSRYPVAWQHINWDIQPPISELLREDGHPVWLKG